MTGTVAIIGAGQIGFAAAEAFVEQGWDVRILARSEPLWLIKGARYEHYVAGEHPSPAADIVLDTIAFDEPDIARYDPEAVGRLITISSASVYVDYSGRTLEKASESGYPDFSQGIDEEIATVNPGPESYSTRKVRMEKKAQELFGSRATNIRPGAIYGPWSRHPREWWFVYRFKDRRRVIPLAFEGQSQFHMTSARSIGELCHFLAEQGLGGHFNIADEHALTVKQIGAIVRDNFGKHARLHLMDGPPIGTVGRTPWSLPQPFKISSLKALDAGFEFSADQVGDLYEAIDWLREQKTSEWRALFPQLAAYPWDLFDYAAEDAYFAAS